MNWSLFYGKKEKRERERERKEREREKYPVNLSTYLVKYQGGGQDLQH